MKLSPFNFLQCQVSLRELCSGGRNVGFANEPSRTASSGDASASGAGTSAPREAEESGSGSGSAATANQAWIDKLEALRKSDQLSDELAELATKDLQGTNATLNQLAKRLADKKIDEDTYEWAQSAATQGSVGAKRLVKALVQDKINAEIFQQALEDMESGDSYLRPLAIRLSRGDFGAEDYLEAKKSLHSQDEESKWAAQMLAQGSLSLQGFKEKLNGVKQKKEESNEDAEKQAPVEAVQKEIHDKVAELLLTVDVVMDQLPEEERTRPLKKLRQNLVTLNHKDRKNHDATVAYLRKLQEEAGLSAEDAKLVMEFDADSEKSKAKEEFKELEQAMTAMGLPEKAIKHLVRLKWEEWRIENDFLDQVRISNTIIKSAVNIIHYETLKERMLDQATKLTGIKLKPGTLIQYTYPDPEHNNLRATAIKKVEIEDAPILDKLGGNVIGRQPAGVRIVLENGEEYNLTRFIKWVNASDVHETYANHSAMEAALGFPETGQRLKPGEKLEYTETYERDSDGRLIPKRKSVGVVAVDDEKVVLEEPVILMRPEEDPGVGLEAPRMAREMNLGEFAKWVRRNEAGPQIKEAEELRARLKDWNAYRNNTEHRSPEEWPPIELKPGEVLQYGNDKTQQAQIDKVEDDKVTLKDGTAMTLPQFLGWVQNNGVERGNPEDEMKRQEKAAERVGEALTPAEKEGLFSKIVKSFERKSSPGSAAGPSESAAKKSDEEKKSIFELFDPLGNNQSKPYSPLRELFNQYTYISVMDIINLGKELLEFIKRKHTRRSKNRYSLLGKNLPAFLGTEFERVNQSAETEEMNTYKDAMSAWGTWQILGKLHSTNSKDEAKACFIVLSEKGEIRWDDMKMWSTLNRLTSASTTDGAVLYIHLTRKPQLNPKTGTKMSGEDRTKDAIDTMWGEGQWAEWFSKNISSYNNAKNAYEFKGKQLEGDPKGTGGLRGDLTRMLEEWKAGNYVCPMEYEELVDFALKYGKLSVEEKMFFLMEGLTAECPSGAMEGMTLLHMDRVGELDGKYLNAFPLLDYLTNKGEKPFHPRFLAGEISLEETKGGYKKEDIAALRDQWFDKASKDSSLGGVGGSQFSQFMWEQMLSDPQFRTRLSKGIRSAQNMDHDDAHVFIPLLTMEDIDMVTGSHTGQQKYFTNEGYKNGYAGFNQYIVSLSNRIGDLQEMMAKAPNDAVKTKLEESIKESESQLASAFQSYYLFDSYLSGRKDRSNSHRARLDKSKYAEGCVVDDVSVGQHQQQLNNTLKEVCEVYGIDWKARKLFDYEPTYGDRAEEERLAAEMERFLKQDLPKVIQEQGYEKMLNIIDKRKRKATKQNRGGDDMLGGIGYCNRLVLNQE